MTDVNTIHGITSDHHAIQCLVDIDCPPPSRRKISFRKIQSIDTDHFQQDIMNSSLYSNRCSNVTDLTDQYNKVLSELLDTHAPIINREITIRTTAPWYNDSLHGLKSERRRLERKLLTTNLTIDKQIYAEYIKTYKLELNKAKCEHYRHHLQNSDGKKLFHLINSLCNANNDKVLPEYTCAKSMANRFATFFDDKIQQIRADLDTTDSQPMSVNLEDKHINSTFEFTDLSHEEVRKIIMESPSKTCSLDPVPTSLFKACIDSLLPIITEIVNKSFSSATMPMCLKMSRVTPILKKANLDPNTSKNYRPVLLLPFVAKVVERCACVQLQSYIETYNFYPIAQSAYRANHGTETALLRVQNDLLCAVDDHCEAIIVLLDLSAAFDTIDHVYLTGSTMAFRRDQLSVHLHSLFTPHQSATLFLVIKLTI